MKVVIKYFLKTWFTVFSVYSILLLSMSYFKSDQIDILNIISLSALRTLLFSVFMVMAHILTLKELGIEKLNDDNISCFQEKTISVPLTSQPLKTT